MRRRARHLVVQPGRLLRQLDRLGTNLLTVSAGRTSSAARLRLPTESPEMVAGSPRSHGGRDRRTGPPRSAATGIPIVTGGIAVRAAARDLLATLEDPGRAGQWLNAATGRYPAVSSARWRPSGWASPGRAPGVDRRPVVHRGRHARRRCRWRGDRRARRWSASRPPARLPGLRRHPTTIYERSRTAAVAAVRACCPDGRPGEARGGERRPPSDPLAAQAATAARSPTCCSASARWPCWSAGSAWPTRW